MPARLRRALRRALSHISLFLLAAAACLTSGAQHGRSAHPPASRHTAAPSGHHAAVGRNASHSNMRGGGHVMTSGRGRASSHAKVAPPIRGRNGRILRERTAPREFVNPAARLDTISQLAYSMAHGGSAISHPAALDSFFDALAAHQADPSSTVRVLQFGDSHTAADMFTGEARRVFQGQFGNGGIGFSYAGHPFAGYRIFGSQRSQSGGWTTLGTHFLDLGDAELGMGGVAISTYSPGQSITLDAPCTSFSLDYLRQPGGGTVQVTDNGASIGDVDTAGDVPSGEAFTYDCPASSPYEDHHFVVTTRNRAPVRLLGTTALQPGVTWESIGINGAQAPLILQWYQPIFTAYLSKTGASLIVLAYGTNEAAASHWTVESYSETFARLVDMLHATLPTAAILVLGPADRLIAVRRHGFAPFIGTERIVESQRDVCRTHNCAFWDTQKRMGGFGSMQRWVYAAWAQHDRTHFNGEGYRVLADALMADLLSGYDSFRAAHGLTVSPTLRGTPPPSAITIPAAPSKEP